jgi:hypothetical protein
MIWGIQQDLGSSVSCKHAADASIYLINQSRHQNQ